ncbi:unnamed protein product, partial [Mycena citricolor]
RSTTRTSDRPSSETISWLIMSNLPSGPGASSPCPEPVGRPSTLVTELAAWNLRSKRGLFAQSKPRASPSSHLFVGLLKPVLSSQPKIDRTFIWR